MSRRKGEQPIPRLLDTWSQDHPVANMVRTGSSWFAAWQMQKCMPTAKLARQTGIAAARLTAISYGDLEASMPDKGLLVE